MGKILFTGCTAKQTDDNAWKRARVKRIDDSSIICNSLRKQGYKVDRRKVQYGDDLSEYDLSIVGIGSFGSNNYSGDILNAMYAIYKAKNVIIFHEDWKIDGTMKSIDKMLDDEILDKTISKRWSNGKPFYGGADHPCFDKNIVKEVIRKISNGEYENALIPAFDWGDKQKVRDILRVKNIFNVDLTPYVLENWLIPSYVEPVIKQRKHMLASLVDHRPWVKRNKFKWEVDYFGAKRIETSELLKTELDVFNKCNHYWSILCPEYPHSGSGWFRIRYIYAAISKSILISSNNDFKALNLEPIDFENSKDTELALFAKKQSENILSYMWNKDTFDKRISKIVDTLTDNKLDKTNEQFTNKQTVLF